VQTEDRHGTAIGHGALGLHQCELMLLIDVRSEHIDQSWVINRQRFPIGSLNIDH
jgi:hypothetical protein